MESKEEKLDVSGEAPQFIRPPQSEELCIGKDVLKFNRTPTRASEEKFPEGPTKKDRKIAKKANK